MTKHLMSARPTGRRACPAAVKHAKVVQVRPGRTSHTDGPFVEAQEQLGGFLLIEAHDLNAAIQMAAQVPLARYGSIEVRSDRQGEERIAP